MKNPKVDTKNRIVCGYVKSINMYCFHKINKNGSVSSKPKLPSVIADNFGEAVDKANLSSSLKLKKTKFKMVVVDISKYKTWDGYIKGVWDESSK